MMRTQALCRAVMLLSALTLSVAAWAQAPAGQAPAPIAAPAPAQIQGAVSPAPAASATPALSPSQGAVTPTPPTITLPHDLSPWGVFMAADIVVKALMVGLAFASVVTWTIWLAKALELMVARARAGRARARRTGDAARAGQGDAAARARAASAAGTHRAAPGRTTPARASASGDAGSGTQTGDQAAGTARHPRCARFPHTANRRPRGPGRSKSRSSASLRPKPRVVERKPVERPRQRHAAAPPPAPPQASAPNPASTGAAAQPSISTASWRGSLIAHLNRYKRFPGGARPGTVQVAFAIDRSGNVLLARLAGSSGDPALDQEVVAMIRRASPVPAPPSGLGGGSISLAVPVRFSR